MAPGSHAGIAPEDRQEAVSYLFIFEGGFFPFAGLLEGESADGGACALLFVLAIGAPECGEPERAAGAGFSKDACRWFY
jgi:hypothetical protein